MFDTLSILEPGISNAVTNVKFELSFAKISKIKQQMNSKIVSRDKAKKFVSGEVEKVQEAFKILAAGSEGKALLESRLKRVIAQSSL